MYFIRDLESTNGTFVNARTIKEELLRIGDQIRIGNTVLVFEDKYAQLRDSSRLMVEDAGWAVAGVSHSAEQAIEMAESTRPDVVLMDIQLKGVLSGVEAARRIVGRRGIPVIFATAYSSAEVIGDAPAPGLFHFLPKPINESALRRILAELAAKGVG